MRQAVVLIHGIGEQKPMGTVRRFVKALLGDTDNPDRPAYWSKPDKMSQLFELRRLRSRGRPSTDFYEYYWAYNLEGTNLRDLGSWLFGLTVRRGKDVPKSAKSLWLLGRVTFIALALSVVLGGATVGYNWFNALPKAGWAWLALIGLLLFAQSIALSYLGDAARYLSPLPRNIKLRQTIRSECVALLRSLHSSNDYDRIIIAGHSLGSIIGLDAITHLWHEYHESMPNLALAEMQAEIRDCLDTRTNPQPTLRDELPLLANALRENGDGIEQFRRCQTSAWRELRHFGNPWRITDFVTLGSPLAHAALLMATSQEDFRSRQRERELLTCPPQSDDKGFAFSGPPHDIGNGRKFTPLLLHHAAAFAVTRWTNLYFPAALGLFGDFVGGPLRGVFGLGIKDVPVSTSKWSGLFARTPLTHTAYWMREGAHDKIGKQGTDRQNALTALQRALDLSSLPRVAPRRGKRKHQLKTEDGKGFEPPTLGS